MVEVRGLVAGYGEGIVLDRVNLALAPGEVVGLLGRNGAGKTTLLRSLMGVVPPSAGQVLVDGVDVAGRRPFEIARRGVGYVPQGREIFAGFTVEENLLLGDLAGGDLQQAFERFPVLAERRRQRADTLSGGEQQQLAIARALMARPRLLLLDEPCEGIQPSIVQAIAQGLERLAREQTITLLLVEQNLEMVLALASRCLIMDRGRIVASHTSAALREDARALERHLAI